MSRRNQRRGWIANFMFRLGGGGAERPSVPKLPRINIKTPPPDTASRRPVRLGIAGLYAIAGRLDALEVLTGLKPAPMPLNGVRRKATPDTWHNDEPGSEADEAEATWQSFCRRPEFHDSYRRQPKTSWKRYRGRQYRPRFVSAAA